MNKEVQKLNHLAADLEMFSGALTAGLSISQSIDLLASRSNESFRTSFQFLQAQNLQHGLPVALSRFKTQAATPQTDLIAELLLCNSQFGGFSLAQSLNELADHFRQRARVMADAGQRLKAVLGVTRLGVASPLIMLILLCLRDENRSAFSSSTGLTIVCSGLALVVMSYYFISRASKLNSQPRGLAN